jgi:hypothetical protein
VVTPTGIERVFQPWKSGNKKRKSGDAAGDKPGRFKPKEAEHDKQATGQARIDIFEERMAAGCGRDRLLIHLQDVLLH